MRICSGFADKRTFSGAGASGRTAITALEILVCIGLITVLLAILIPAIQSSRQSSSRVSCVNRQRQLGVALQTFLATHHRFPSDNEKCFSWHVAVLPILEQSSLYDQIREAGRDCWTLAAMPQLEELQQSMVPLFHCPADPEQKSVSTNYLGNAGVGFYPEKNGTFSRKPARVADIKDGLSNTAAVSEFLSGWGKQPIESIDAPAQTLGDWKNLFVPACEAAVPSGEYPGALMGAAWMRPGYPITVYSHVLSPGRNSCSADGVGASMVTTPRSNHSGGVNLLMADGHIQFVANSIDTSVWRKFGARDDSVSIWED